MKLPSLTTISQKKYKLIISFFIVLICFLFGTNYIVNSNASNKIYSDIANLQETDIALVLGAGVRKDGTPSAFLRNRVEAGVALYKEGKVKKLLMSGDNRAHKYNEPKVMKDLAITLGVPENDIKEDFAGRRTYDSCWRAKNIFSADNVIIVTQQFHLPRSIYLCEKLGLKTEGYIALEPNHSSGHIRLKAREAVAVANSFIDLYVFHPSVVKGDKISL